MSVEIPEIIKKNKFIIGFPITENKSVFYCLAYHKYTSARPSSMIKLAKDEFRTYCSLSGIEYTNDLFRGFKPIDHYQFSELEHMFSIGINVYEVDIDSWEFTKTREAGEGYENVMSILDYNNHALYIKDIDTLMGKYHCSKCESIFETSGKLYNHNRIHNRADDRADDRKKKIKAFDLDKNPNAVMKQDKAELMVYKIMNFGEFDKSKVLCPCGSTIGRYNYTTHCNTQKHILWSNLMKKPTMIRSWRVSIFEMSGSEEVQELILSRYG